LGGQKNRYAGFGKENKATGSGREIWQFNLLKPNDIYIYIYIYIYVVPQR